MELFTWDNKYSLGRSDLDSEHQALFPTAEHLYNAIGQGTSQDELTALFARLTSYARFHFENEEAPMRKTGFPDYEQHRREHTAVTAKIALLQGELQAGIARRQAYNGVPAELAAGPCVRYRSASDAAYSKVGRSPTVAADLGSLEIA